MINYMQLLINDPATAELDLDSTFDIALQYSLADIRDISKRNSAYSKTIILPGTKKNNYWMGNLFDINSDFTFFNPNKKTKAKFLVNTETVINGFLQLRKINKLVNADAQGNMIQYEVVIYNNAVDLMTELGESTLYQLNLFDYSHTFNQASIEASWTHTWEDGYVYPMYGTENKNYQYNADWFWPCPFYKTVFDRIITDAGYGWTGSFKENEQFNKEIIAFVKDGNVYIGQDEVTRRQFRASVIPTSQVDYGRHIVSFSGGFPLLIFQSAYGAPYPANNDTTAPNFDNGPTASGGNWNTTTYEWTLDRNGGYRVDYAMNYDFILKNTTSYTANIAGSGTQFNVNLIHKLKYSTDGGTTWIIWDTYTVPITFTGGSIGVGSQKSISVAFERLMTDVKYLNLGTKVKLEIDPRSASTYYFPYQSFTQPGGAPLGMNVVFNWKNTNNYILNHAEPSEITQGDIIDLGAFLPDKIKQKDLISDLIKRYNLYIELSPNDDKLLIFTERPNYYDSGEILDWTYKKDFSSQDNIELLSELQFKSMLFTYKPDKDYYNDYYERETGDVYGQYEYIFDNDFVKGEKKIESPFSPTPLVKTQFGSYVAAIDPEDPKTNPRFLYWGGLKTYGDNWEMIYQDTNLGGTYTVAYSSYPYAGHWDDPIQPTLDIHFDVPKKTFFSEWDQIPTNTMYNTYWSDFISQIEDGRLVTSSFYLTEADIRYIKDNFNSKIFVLDSYYYINKIVDYKPLENGLTKVELIKIREGITWLNEGDSGNTYATFSCPDDIVARRFKTGWYYVSSSGATVSEECCNISNGIYDPITGSCKAKRVNPVVGWADTKLGANRAVVVGGNGNSGQGVIFGNTNKTGGQRVIYKYLIDYSWILSTGSWNDDGVWIDTCFWQDSGTSSLTCGETYSFTVNNTQLAVGDNNDLSANNNFSLGSGNILSSEGSSVFSGDNNIIENGSIIIGASGLTISASASPSIYLGPSFSVDITTGAINISGSTFSISGTAGYIPKFTDTSTLVNSGWVDTGDITAYRTSGLTYSAVFYDYQALLPKGTLNTPGIAFLDNQENGFYHNSGNVYAVVSSRFVIMSAGLTAGYFDSKGLNMDANVIIDHRWNVVNRSATYSITSAVDNYITMSNGGTVYLPLSSGGRPLTIKNIGTQSVIVEGTASQPIDDQLSVTLSQWDSIDLIGGSSGWIIV